MPLYRCPKCGRTAELPEGKYYCKVCGPSATMRQVTNKSAVLEEKVKHAVDVVWARDRIIRAVADIQHEVGISDRDVEKILSELSRLWAIVKKEAT